jgi:hypothetical protein
MRGEVAAARREDRELGGEVCLPRVSRYLPCRAGTSSGGDAGVTAAVDGRAIVGV